MMPPLLWLTSAQVRFLYTFATDARRYLSAIVDDVLPPRFSFSILEPLHSYRAVRVTTTRGLHGQMRCALLLTDHELMDVWYLAQCARQQKVDLAIRAARRRRRT